MKEAKYISDEEFDDFLREITQRLENGEVEEIRTMLDQMLEDTEVSDRYIDRTYIGAIKEKKRNYHITEIEALLQEMNSKQVENVYNYVIDEHAEQDHEAVALAAITRLSKERGEVKSK